MNNRTILIVDDDKDWLRSISGFFRYFNYDVKTARTCAEGLALARLHRPACVLLDFHLPGDNGGFLCAQLRADQELRKTLVIIVSVDIGQEYSSYLKYQADAFILKGGPMNRIRVVVESMMRRACWERGILEEGDMRLETKNCAVFRNSRLLARLSPVQFRFLFKLIEKSNCFVSEDEAMKFVFETDGVPEKFEALRGLASRLRAKLGRQVGRRIKSRNLCGWIYTRPPEDKRRGLKGR